MNKLLVSFLVLVIVIALCTLIYENRQNKSDHIAIDRSHTRIKDKHLNETIERIHQQHTDKSLNQTLDHTAIDAAHKEIQDKEKRNVTKRLDVNIADTLFQCKSLSSSIDLKDFKNASSFRTNDEPTALEISALGGLKQEIFDPVSGKQTTVNWKKDFFLRENGQTESPSLFSFCLSLIHI